MGNFLLILKEYATIIWHEKIKCIYKKGGCMNNREFLLKDEKLIKAMLIIILPAIISVVISQSSYIVDSIFLMQYNVKQLSILTLSQPLNIIVNMIVTFIIAGSTPLLSQELGRQNYDKARSYFMSMLISVVVLGLIYIFIMFSFTDKILLDVLSIPESLLAESKTYIYPIIWANLFLITASTMEAVAISQGETKRIMNINLVSLIINISLNAIFMYHFELGLFGLGLATLIATLFKNILYISGYLKQDKLIYFTKSYLFNKDYTYAIFVVSGAAFGMMFLTLIAQLLGNAMITNKKFSGNDYEQILVLKSMVTILFNFCTAFMIGVMQTTQTFISYNFGAKNYKRMVKSAKIAIIFSLSMALVLAISILVGKSYLYNTFVIQSGAELLFNVAIYATCLSLFAMPLTFLVTILARSMNRSRVLYYHQWITNGFMLIGTTAIYPFIFSEVTLAPHMAIGQITMLIFSIPSYYYLLKYIKLLLNVE